MQINIYVKGKLLHRTQSYFLISTINDCRGIRNDALINNYKDARVWRSADNTEPLALQGGLKSLAAHV